MKSRSAHHLVACLALVTLAASCGSPGDNSPSGDGGGATPTTIAAPTTDRTNEPTSQPVAAPEPIVPELPLVRLLSPLVTTTELAPEFSWEPVVGAATYRLAVVGADGPVWAWEGTSTSVRLGGFTEDRPQGFPGPVLDQSTTWSVVALAADGAVVATSDLRPLAPALVER
jgi:hypothetical protein